MKFIYYSLFQFYTKILRVHKYYAPVVNIAGIIALFQTLIIFSFLDIGYYILADEATSPFSAYVSFGVGLVLYYFNEKYFEKNELKIISDIDKKSIFTKIISHVLTIALMVIVSWGYLFDGFINLIPRLAL